MAGKTKREKPCKPRGVDSKGSGVGAKRTRLDAVSKVLLGKGAYQRWVPIGSAGNGRG